MMRNWKFLLKLFEKHNPKRGAEIGVFEGDTSVELLKAFKNLTLYCVDPWANNTVFHQLMPKKHGRILSADMRQVFKLFKQRVKPYKDRVIIMRQNSIDAAKRVEDGSLDFAFIDGNHAYGFVKEDTLAWTPKVKIGGIICGDDYNPRKKNYGVIEAVNELFPDKFNVHRKSRVWYLTKEEEL
jgi:predicted O-methyltransferase YrrM